MQYLQQKLVNNEPQNTSRWVQTINTANHQQTCLVSVSGDVRTSEPPNNQYGFAKSSVGQFKNSSWNWDLLTYAPAERAGIYSKKCRGWSSLAPASLYELERMCLDSLPRQGCTLWTEAAGSGNKTEQHNDKEDECLDQTGRWEHS